ncbi:MAG: glutathione S-transferase [Pseudomonadota bacterium]
MLKFYDCKTAPSPRRARMVLAEKGLEVETVEVDLRSGEQLSDAFRAINPQCTVPVLVLEDGTRFTENAAIAAYAEAIKPDPPLLGSTPTEKGLVAGYNIWVEFQGLWAVAEVLRNTASGFAGRALTGPDNYQQIPELAERGRSRLIRFLDQLEERLEGRAYVAIDAFTVADITAFITAEFAGWVKVDVNDGRPNVAAYRERVSARPSAKL